MFPINRSYKNERGIVHLGFTQAGDAQLRIKLILATLYQVDATPLRDIMLTSHGTVDGHPEYNELIAAAIQSIDFRQVERELFTSHTTALLDARDAANKIIASQQAQLQKIEAELGMSEELSFKGLFMQAVSRIQAVLTQLTN